jgi:hypothetical protein
MKKCLTTIFACAAMLFDGCAPTSPYPVYRSGYQGGGGSSSRSYYSGGDSKITSRSTYNQQQIINVQQNPQYNQRINKLNQRLQQQQEELATQAKQQQLQEMEVLKQRNASQEEITALQKRWRNREHEQEVRLRDAHEQEIQQLRQEFAGTVQEQQQGQQPNTVVNPTRTTTPDPVLKQHEHGGFSVDLQKPVAVPKSKPTPTPEPAPSPTYVPPGRDALFEPNPDLKPTTQTPQKRHKNRPNNDADTLSPDPEQTQEAPQRHNKHRD